MTVELGNINKGIPMGSYAPGEGGGGGAQVTGVDPIAVTNGSVAIKIDEQTLQVNEQGELSANLDEIGSELNDLSGRVTAAEADILQKQDAFVASAPLQLTERSPLELQSDKLSYDNNTGILSYASGTQEDATARIDLSRLHLKTHEPYTLHLRAGRQQYQATGSSNFFRLQCYNDGTDTTFRGVRVWNGSGRGRAGATNTDANALQLNSTDYVHYEFRYDGTNGISEYRGRNNGDESLTTTLPINKFTDQAGDYSKFENEFTQLLLNCYYGYAGKFDLSKSYIEQNNVKYILKDVIAEGISTLQLNVGDGLAITNGKLTATGGGGASGPEKYGIEGDYCSKYGILECPDGIFTVSGMQMTLQPGVVMQCAGLDSKTTNSSAMAHTVTSTSDFDIFYTSGQFIEATQVVFSTQEPDDGATGYLAWWDPSRADKKWQFKSNDTGNVWAAAPACRLAHVHTDGTTITRIDYIGNRQMDDGVFVDVNADNNFTGTNSFNKRIKALEGVEMNKVILHQGNGAYNQTANIGGKYVEGLVVEALARSADRPTQGTIQIQAGSDKYAVLDSGNLSSYVDGTTVTYANGKLSAAGGTGGGLDVDLSNISATGKSKVSDYVFPSDRYVDLTLGASGSVHTAPANGYVYVGGVFVKGYILVCVNPTDNTDVNTSRVTAKYSQGTNNTSDTPVGEGFITSVNKGDTYTIWYSGVTTFEAHKFFYAKGEVV